MATIDRKLLARAWAHAHEEDHDGLQVFKPLGAALPPSRGRRVIDLSQAEKLIVTKPDASDRPTSHDAHWRLVDDQLSFSDATHEQCYHVESLSDCELVLKPLQ
jgi:hypothetical protein